mgnify:CR=1 FL=1
MIRTILTIGTAVLVPLLTALAFKALKKLNLEVSGQQQAKIEYFVRQAVLEAEEWGARRVQAKFPVLPKDKLERALASVVDRVPNISTEEAAALIHSELPKVSLGATSFLRAGTEKAQS